MAGRPFNFDVVRNLYSSDYFHGQLDKLRVDKRALSGAELAAIRSSNSVCNRRSLLCLPFTETERTTVGISGVGSTGSVRDGATTATGQYGSALALDGVDDSIHLACQLRSTSAAARSRSWRGSDTPPRPAKDPVVSL